MVGRFCAQIPLPCSVSFRLPCPPSPHHPSIPGLIKSSHGKFSHGWEFISWARPGCRSAEACWEAAS